MAVCAGPDYPTNAEDHHAARTLPEILRRTGKGSIKPRAVWSGKMARPSSSLALHSSGLRRQDHGRTALPRPDGGQRMLPMSGRSCGSRIGPQEPGPSGDRAALTGWTWRAGGRLFCTADLGKELPGQPRLHPGSGQPAAGEDLKTSSSPVAEFSPREDLCCTIRGIALDKVLARLHLLEELAHCLPQHRQR